MTRSIIGHIRVWGPDRNGNRWSSWTAHVIKENGTPHYHRGLAKCQPPSNAQAELVSELVRAGDLPAGTQWLHRSGVAHSIETIPVRRKGDL